MLRFENFSADDGAGWAGRGIAEGLAAAIGQSASLHALSNEELHRSDALLGKRLTAVPGISYELPNTRVAFATRVIGGYYYVSGPNVEIFAVEMAPATQKTMQVKSAHGPLSQLPDLTLRLARDLGYPAPAPVTLSAAALRGYSEALETPDAKAASEKYQAAVAADPAFGRAYVAWARGALAAKDRAGFDLAMSSSAHAGRINPFDRASIAALRAEVRGDPQGRLSALKDLVRAAPADSLALRFLGDAEIALGNYPNGIAQYEQAIHATPQDADLHNLLAYAYLTQGNQSAALREGAEYGRLAQGANPVDSLGDIQFHFNHFEEALKLYLESYRRDPELDAGGSLEKAAVSQLLAGDLAKANQLHQRYVRERAARRDPVAALRHADWLFLTGHRQAAIDAAKQFVANAAGSAPLQVAALTRMAAWQLQLGQTLEAAQSARAAGAPGNPGQPDLTALLALFSAPLDDAAFSAQVARLYPGPVGAERRALAEAYRLIFHRQWDLALPVWRQLSQNPNAQTARALYAWLLLRNGNKAEAARLAATTPLWHPNQDDVFSGVWFPRLIQVRAATGVGAEAEKDARVYQAIARP